MSTENEAMIVPVTETSNDLGQKIIKFEYEWPVKESVSITTNRSRLFSPSFNKQLLFFLETTDLDNLAAVSLGRLACGIPEITLGYQLSWRGGEVMIACSSRCGKKISEGIRYKSDCSESHHKLKSWPHYVNPIICCKIEVIVDASDILQFGTLPRVPGSELVENLRQLFETPQYSDVIIHVSGVSNTDEFSAHKAILSMRSPVFSAMFEHEMSEKQENRVNVTDIEPEVFQEVLRFIYTDAPASVEKMAEKLLAAAEKYQIGRLKAICEDAIRAKLTVENAADTLIFGDLHNAGNLKKWAISFINANLKPVIATPGFQSTFRSHPYLIAEILNAWAGR